MEKRIVFRLSNPGYTIYHRAALGGLAATVLAWKDRRSDMAPSSRIRYDLGEDSVTLAWDDSVEDTEALREILSASFGLDSRHKLIDLPGHGLTEGQLGLRVAVHQALCGTFLQHNKMRPSTEKLRTINLAGEEEDGPRIVSYKPVDSYAHMSAQGTDLFKKKPEWPAMAKVPQSVVPGALSGAIGLEVPGEEAFLLLYLIVGCPLYTTRAGTEQEKYQYAIIVPDVTHLQDYAESLQAWMGSERKQSRLFGYEERVTGGMEEAAMHFLMHMEAIRISRRRGVRAGGVGGCLTLAMGKVPWDKNQINRSLTKIVRWEYEEREVFRAALASVLGEKLTIVKEGAVYIVPATSVPALVAANLANGDPWYLGLSELMAEQKNFIRMLTRRGGFRSMYEQIQNEQDRLFIEAFHEAWRRTLGQLGERSKKEGVSFARLCEVEQEKMRNTILRLRTSEALASWFLQFCTSATRGGTLSAAQTKMGELHGFLFSPRNFTRLQNLSLFGLLSYQRPNEEETGEEGDVNP